MKKRKGKADYVDPRTGKTNQEHYMVVDPETGEVHFINPEFCLMSRRPGIGHDWLRYYRADTDKDFITLRGVKHKLPKYYDSIIEQEDIEAMLERKDQRRKRAAAVASDNTIERLAVKRKVKEAQLTHLKRGYENDS